MGKRATPKDKGRLPLARELAQRSHVSQLGGSLTQPVYLVDHLLYFSIT